MSNVIFKSERVLQPFGVWTRSHRCQRVEERTLFVQMKTKRIHVETPLSCSDPELKIRQHRTRICSWAITWPSFFYESGALTECKNYSSGRERLVTLTIGSIAFQHLEHQSALFFQYNDDETTFPSSKEWLVSHHFFINPFRLTLPCEYWTTVLLLLMWSWLVWNVPRSCYAFLFFKKNETTQSKTQNCVHLNKPFKTSQNRHTGEEGRKGRHKSGVMTATRVDIGSNFNSQRLGGGGLFTLTNRKDEVDLCWVVERCKAATHSHNPNGKKLTGTKQMKEFCWGKGERVEIYFCGRALCVGGIRARHLHTTLGWRPLEGVTRPDKSSGPISQHNWPWAFVGPLFIGIFSLDRTEKCSDSPPSHKKRECSHQPMTGVLGQEQWSWLMQGLPNRIWCEHFINTNRQRCSLHF